VGTFRQSEGRSEDRKLILALSTDEIFKTRDEQYFSPKSGAERESLEKLNKFLIGDEDGYGSPDPSYTVSFERSEVTMILNPNCPIMKKRSQKRRDLSVRQQTLHQLDAIVSPGYTQSMPTSQPVFLHLIVSHLIDNIS
jgi:hypothetical protein